MKSKILLLLLAALLAPALIGHGGASEIDLLAQDENHGSDLLSMNDAPSIGNENELLIDNLINSKNKKNPDNAKWDPESWLCTLNNELCKGTVTDSKTNENRKVEGGIFTVIDDALENHAADVKIRMFEYRIAKNGDNSDFVAQEVKRLNDELSNTQTKREILGRQLKEGAITDEEYAAALRKIEREENSNKKQAREMAEVVRNNLKDDKLSTEFDKISKGKEDESNRNGKNDKKETGSGTKGRDNVIETEGNSGTSGEGKSGESGKSGDGGSSGGGGGSGGSAGGSGGGGSSSGGSGGGSSGGGGGGSSGGGGSGGSGGGGNSGGGGSGGGSGGSGGSGGGGGNGGGGGGGNSGGNS